MFPQLIQRREMQASDVIKGGSAMTFYEISDEDRGLAGTAFTLVAT